MEIKISLSSTSAIAYETGLDLYVWQNNMKYIVLVESPAKNNNNDKGEIKDAMTTALKSKNFAPH